MLDEVNTTNELLNEEEIHKLVSEIISSEKIENIEIEGNKEFIIFKVPNSTEKTYAEYVEEQALEEVLKKGCPSEADIPPELIESFFSTEDAEDLHELELKIEGYNTLLSKRIKGTDLYNKDNSKLKELEEKRAVLLSKKNEADQYTAEHMAREEKLISLLCFSAADQEGNKKWASREDLLELHSTLYVYSMLNKFLSFYFGPDTSVIRQIARSGEWRNIYLASIKTGMDIFDKSAKDLSSTQLQLLSWSMYYQNIYELPFSDRPNDDTIDDDEKLDKYMISLSRKIKEEERTIDRSNRGHSKLNAKDSDHVIIAAESSDYIKFNKEDNFSDPALISNRADDASTSYSDAKDKQQLRQKIRKLNRK